MFAPPIGICQNKSARQHWQPNKEPCLASQRWNSRLWNLLNQAAAVIVTASVLTLPPPQLLYGQRMVPPAFPDDTVNEIRSLPC
jgi:hypothetical protein